jgi:MFS family permease
MIDKAAEPRSAVRNYCDTCAGTQAGTPDMDLETRRADSAAAQHGAGGDERAAPPLAGLLWLGVAVGTVNGLSRVAMPLFASSLGAQPWQVGIVGGLGYTGLVLLALPMGAWLERHGSRVLFMLGVGVAAALFLLLPLAHSPMQAIAAAAVLGLLLPLRIVPIYAEFLAILPRLSPARAGWNRAASTLGMFFLGPAAAGAVIAASGYTPVFQLAACALLAAFLVARRVLVDRERPARGAAQSLAERVRGQYRLLCTDAEIRRTMAIDFLAQMTVAYFTVFVLILAVHQFGMSVQAAAGLVTVQGSLYVLTLFAGGAVLVRWREDLSYLLAFALLLAQGLLCGLATGPAALWLGAALSGIGLGLQGLTSTTRFAAFLQRHGRGRIGGLTSLGPPAGGVIGVMLGGVVSQRLGTQAGFLLLAVGCALLCAAQWSRLRAAPAP